MLLEQHLPRRVLDARLADPAELSGVLNKALSVLPSLRSRGFTESQSMKQAAMEFRQTTDPLAVWLDHATIQGPEVFVAKDVLLTAYNAHCEKKGTPGQTRQNFGRAIHKLLPHLEEKQRMVGGKLTWVWLGLGLKNVDIMQPSPPQGSPLPGSQSSHDSRDSRDFPYCYF